MEDREARFYAEDVYPVRQGLAFKFANSLEAQKFYLHLQHKGATAVLEGTEVVICSRRNIM